MAKPTPEESFSSLLPAEHDAASVPRLFTAWHHFLAQALKKTRAPGFDVHCFVKLGSLPLEADIIILHLDQRADIQQFAQYFSFLVPSLRRYLVLEYKSPDDHLTLSDFDTVRAYAMLCKRNYLIAHDQDVAVAMLYSRTETDFFAGCARNGFPFVETQPGMRGSCNQPMSFYAVDLMTWGERHPEHPINLLSARRRGFGASGLPSGLGPFDVLYEQVFFTELKKMSQLHVPGTKELLEDADKTLELIMAHAGVDRRLRGLSPEERLRGLAPEERLRGLAPEERLRGLAPEEMLRRLSPEEMLRGLGPTERARLRELLLKQENR